jgi:ABC-type multidrug transport system fused ATPase/permease subunit
MAESIGKIVWHSLTTRERRKLWFIWVLILVSMVLETFSLGMVLPLIAVLTDDSYRERFPGVYSFLGEPSTERLLVIGVAVLLMVYIVKNVYFYVSTRIQRRFLNDASARLSQLAFSRYLRQPYEFHLQHNSATLINNAEVAKSIVSGGLDPFLTLLTDGLVAIGLFVLLLVVEPIGTVSTIAVFGLSAGLFQLATRKKIAEWGRLRKKHLALVLQHLQQGLGGAKEVKLLGRERKFLDDHEEHLVASMEISRKFSLMQMLPRLWLEVIAIASLVALVGVMTATSDDVTQILPVLGLFAATAFRVIPSIGRIIASIQAITFAAPQIRSVYKDLGIDVPEEAGPSRVMSFVGKIEFRNVSFSYESGNKASLNDVSLEIQCGESVGIVGPSGAGKSTLVDILLGLLAPTSGEIFIDDVPMSSNVRGWQSLVGYVPQSIYLTDDSLKKNVAFGLHERDIDSVAVESAIAAAQLSEFVATLPNGLDTVVGERGVRLSGGQRQRIGIARALYNNPKVLVLDEATSALDSETESGVMDAVRSLQGERTVIIVAHRLSTVEHCSRIFTIEDSRLVATRSLAR